eukprot:TRINITY_DN364_c1_g1_i1.p1 TRINITY_DN364_c1_g1~~TRINITY_DN364_c1_g1_i1.p1  ORF type:complete len:1324 (+),score=185.08 TRINITY_DN364_c1_g1_i1:6701-10672(+)
MYLYDIRLTHNALGYFVIIIIMQKERKALPNKIQGSVEVPKQDPSKLNPEQADAQKVSLFSLYRFAGGTEKILIFIGIIASICVGVCGPLISVFFGAAINGFSPTNSPDTVLDKVAEQCLLMVYLGIFAFVTSALVEATWTATGERLGVKVRTLYLQSVLQKEVSWFDTNRPQELPTKIASLVSKYQGGIGEKVGKVGVSITMFISGLIVAFIYGWQLALVLVGLSPLTILAANLIGVANSRGMEISKQGYARCGGYAEEALSAIRTVYAFCAETFEKNKYLKELSKAQEASVKNSMILGVAVGLINLAMSLSHGLGYFIGSFFIQYNVYNYTYKEDYTCGHVMTVFFAILFAMMSLGLIAPQLKSIGEAQIAAYDIYGVIDSVNEANRAAAVEGSVKIPMEKFKGRIEFHNVTFCYPTRPDVKVLDNFSMAFEEGKMIGICGETGSGKSTIIQLVERFYKPTSGKITVDGIDINTLDLKWWREMVSYVGQEPVLFNASIKENIEYGKEGATQQQIETAASQANATEFIKKLQSGYNTITGNEGSQLSGGQRQRIAIARALIKRPRILLLDEATSALDNTSEAKVQEAFYKLQKEQGMTVLVIAHRLSTIKSADKIIVLNEGVLKEEGDDRELRSKNSIYANLCRLQENAATDGANIEVEVDDDNASSKRKSSVGRKSSVHEEDEKKPTEEPKLSKEEEEKKMQALAAKSKQYSSELWKETWKYSCPLIFSIVFAGLCGLYTPSIGVLFGMVSIDLLEPDEEELRRKINIDFIGFVSSGVGMFFFTLGMFWLFGYVAAKVTQNLRERLYDHVLKMNVGWFDLPTNVPSTLNSILAEGTDNVNGVVRMVTGVLIQSMASLVAALIIGFVFSWKIALIVLACVPIMGLSGFLQTRFQVGFATKNEELYRSSMKILSEAVKNFRTVASFSSEERILKMYSNSLSAPLSESQYAAVISGLLFGASQLLPYFIYAGLFYFAALFLQKYDDPPRETFIAVYTLLFSAASIGQIQQYAPDMGKAYSSLFSIFGILEQEPSIVPPQNPTKNPIKGRIEFKNVTFKYPTREDYVLKDFSATIEPGQKVAIVGISGSGKSTLIQLLERFYDVNSGQILIDGVDVKEYSLNDLRKSMGFVPQDPVLFDTTIEENVKYNYEEATKEDVVEACKIADAMEFINRDSKEGREEVRNLPGELVIDLNTGFNRKVGAKGSLLSGGQKQRLAIARAVLRKPKIMLFDEATSALDSETERVVQKALNQVSAGRTSIVIAHRLGTIEEGDTIFVLENGKVVESGNKKELEEKRGSFYKLYRSTVNASQIDIHQLIICLRNFI